jgi:hypothetical protein
MHRLLTSVDFAATGAAEGGPDAGRALSLVPRAYEAVRPIPWTVSPERPAHAFSRPVRMSRSCGLLPSRRY